MLAACLTTDQISPNPNPVGGVIANSSETACNGLTFENLGSFNNASVAADFSKVPIDFGLTATFVNEGSFTNAGSMLNRGADGNRATFFNNGTFINTGTLTNRGGGGSGGSIENGTGFRFENRGVLVNELDGNIVNRGAFTNAIGATLTNNFGTIDLRAGTFTNDGLLTNIGSGSTFMFISGAFSNTLDGRLDNAGNVFVTGTLSNAGNITNKRRLSVGNTLNNSGTLDNISTIEELNITGRLSNTGALTNGTGATTRIDGGTLANGIGGVFVNKGRVDNFGQLVNDGRLENRSGATLFTGFGKSVTNNGTFTNQNGASVSNTGTVLNNAGASVVNDGLFDNGAFGTPGNIVNKGDFTNNGVVNNIFVTPSQKSALSNQGTFSNNGTFSNPGQIGNSGLFVIGAQGSIAGTGSYVQTAGITEVLGRLTQATLSIDGGLLRGSGNIAAAVTNNGGTLAPGNSPGVLTISGDYTQGAAGTLLVELGGLAAGAQYDVLAVTGTATLDGRLDITLYNLGGGTFVPHLGEAFDILNARDIVGRFSVLPLAGPAAGLAWGVEYLHDVSGTTDVVRLSVLASPTAVPEPATHALWIAGLGFIAGVARRRTGVSATRA